MKASRHQGIQASSGYTIDGVTYVAGRSGGRSAGDRAAGGLRLVSRREDEIDETLSWAEALAEIGCRGRSKDTFKRITTEGAVSGGERIVLATVPRPGGHRVTRAAIAAFITAFEAAAKRGRRGAVTQCGPNQHGGRLDVRG